MTQQERDMMVERYLDGTMSQSERHEFLDLLDRDEGMRQTLYAETLINKAVKVDRMAMPMPAAASRARFMAMLATVAPETAAPVAGSGSSGGSGVAGKGAMATKGLAGSGAAKVIVSAITGIALTVGAIVVVPKLVESPAPKTPAAVSQPKAAAPAPQEMIAPPSVEAPLQVTTGETTPAATVETRGATAAPAAQKRSGGVESIRKEGMKVAQKSRTAESAHGGSSATPEQERDRVINDPTSAKANVKPAIIQR